MGIGPALDVCETSGGTQKMTSTCSTSAWYLSEAMAKKSDDVIIKYGSSEGTDSGSSEENADVIMDDWEDL